MDPKHPTDIQYSMMDKVDKSAAKVQRQVEIIDDHHLVSEVRRVVMIPQGPNRQYCWADCHFHETHDDLTYCWHRKSYQSRTPKVKTSLEPRHDEKLHQLCLDRTVTQ